MQTINTHQTIGLYGTTYQVTAEDGRVLGTYHQDHGADVVTSDHLLSAESGVVGPIEAIVSIAHAAGVRGFKISDKVNRSYSEDFLDLIAQRAKEHGGVGKVHVTDLFKWGHQYGLEASVIMGAMVAVDDRESVPA